MILGRHQVTLQEWLVAYCQGGIAELLAHKIPSGRRATIPDWAVKAINKRLQDPAEFRSYQEVKKWLKDTLGIEASYLCSLQLGT